MKAFFSILCVALVAKNCLGDSLNLDEGAKDAFDAVKVLVGEQKTMVESVLKDMPNTESYAPYRTVWKNFLKNYDIHDESEVCFERLMKLMNGFNDIFPKYPKVTAPAEEKEIWRLFDMHGINDFLVKSRAIFSNANTNNIDFASNRDRC